MSEVEKTSEETSLKRRHLPQSSSGPHSRHPPAYLCYHLSGRQQFPRLPSGEKDLTEPGRRNESRDGPTHLKSLGGRRLMKGQVSGNLLTSGAHALISALPSWVLTPQAVSWVWFSAFTQWLTTTFKSSSRGLEALPLLASAGSCMQIVHIINL